MLRAVEDAVVNFLFRRMPPEPVISKWTKLLPAMSWFMSTMVFGLLHNIVRGSHAKFTYPQTPRTQQREETQGEQGTTVVVRGEVDADDELTWHEVAGVRLRRTLLVSGCDDSRFTIHLICIIVEPLRLLHMHFLRTANAGVNGKATPLWY